ncbi:MAG: copper resistance protein CopC [Ilumatobacteraceae bacterium]
MTTTARRVTLVVLAALCGLAIAGQAFAHASLKSSDPADGAVLDVAPTEIVLRFTEPVDPVDDSIRLLDGTGTRIPLGSVEQSLGADTMRVELPAELAEGTYAVGWSAVSADSHPIGGAYVFSIGAASTNPGSLLLAQARQSSTATDGGALMLLGRWASATGLAVLAGVVATIGWLAPDRVDTRRSGRLLGAAAVLAGVGTVAMIATQSSLLNGSWAPTGWSDVLDTRSGRWWFARLIPVALAPAAIRLRSTVGATRRGRIGSGVASVATLAVYAAGGHAVTGRWMAIGFAATVAHLAAMAIWLGALVVLAVVVEPGRLMRAARSFSPAAVASVVVLAVSGTLNAVRQLSSVGDFTGTSYGRWLLVKLAVVVVVIAIAAVSRQTLGMVAVTRPSAAHQTNTVPTTPAHAGLSGSAPDTTSVEASEPSPPVPPPTSHVPTATSTPPRIRLRRTVVAEIVGIGFVLVATAAIAASTPPIAVGPPAPVTATASAIQGERVAQLELAPARTGGTTMHVNIFSPGGTLDKADEITVSASLPAQGLGPIDVGVVPAGPNHVTTDRAVFPVAGTWTVTVTARYGEFDQVVFTMTVDVV